MSTFGYVATVVGCLAWWALSLIFVAMAAAHYRQTRTHVALAGLAVVGSLVLMAGSGVLLGFVVARIMGAAA